jgi:hypothetical protein
MKKYIVEVYEHVTIWKNEKDQRHCEDGPAVIGSNGSKEWWLKGQKLTEEEFNERINPVKELTVVEIENLLGYRVKIVKG